VGNPYDWAHQKERAEWDRTLVANGPVTCRRCSLLVYPDRQRHLNPDRAKFDLGHPDPGQMGKQPEHQTCNRGAGGREGRRRTQQPASREWW